MSRRRKKPTRTNSPNLPAPKSNADSEFAGHLPDNSPPSGRSGKLVAQQSFSGPIPHPDIFKKYGEVIPDAPERILRVFEEDSCHARDIANKALDAQKADNKRTHWMAWSLIFSGLVLVGLLAWLNKDVLAGIVAGTTLAGTIASLINGSRDKRISEPDPRS